MAITRNWKICKSRIVGNTIVMLNVNFVTLYWECQILVIFWHFIYWYFGPWIYCPSYNFHCWKHILWFSLLFLGYFYENSYCIFLKSVMFMVANGQRQLGNSLHFFIYKDKSLRRRVLGLTVKMLSHDTHKM